MSGDRDSNASVRIEVESHGGAEVPQVYSAVASPSGGGKNNATIVALASLVAGLIIVGGLIFVLAPESGTTAVGTPVTSPTSAPVTTLPSVSSTTDSSERDDAVPDENAIVGFPDADDGFETEEIDFFMIDIVEVEIGWFAFGWQQTQSDSPFGLFRSIDGLTWNRVDGSDFPGGDILGLARVDGSYLLAVDENEGWTAQNQSGSDDESLVRPFHVTFWESADAASWTVAAGRPPIEGSGLPYPVVMTDEGAFMTSFEWTLDAGDGLVAYLAPLMEADLARQVCDVSVTSMETDDGLRPHYVFFDCDGNEVVEILVEEANALDGLGNSSPDVCVGWLRNQSARGVMNAQLVDGRSFTATIGSNLTPLGAAVGSTFLASIPPTGPGPECGEAADGSGTGSLFRWSPDDGASYVELSDEPSGFNFNPIVTRADGTAILITQGGVAMLQPPHRSVEDLDLSFPTGTSGSIGSDSTLSVSDDGQWLMARRSNAWQFSRFGSTTYTEIEVRRSEPAIILLATATYAIVQVEGTTTTLVKVPLS